MARISIPQASLLTRIFTNTGIRLCSSFSITPPHIKGDRIVYPSTNYDSNYRADCDWIPPLRVSCIWKYVKSYMNHHDYYYRKKAGSCPRLVLMCLNGVKMDSEKELNEFYVKMLGYALGSEEEAKRRIYLVSVGCCYAFGAKFDFDALRKLEVLNCVCGIFGDLDHLDRKEDPSDEPFAPRNLNFRLETIFSYHHLSERNSKWNSDHWLIGMKQFDDVPTTEEFDELCVKLLTEVVGSKMKAMQKIYAVWYKSPTGFGAEIDEEDAMKLQGMEEVFKVFPDYAFDTKARCLNEGLALQVRSSYYDLKFSSYHSEEESDSESEDCLVTGSLLLRQNRTFTLIRQSNPYNDIFSYHYMNRVKSHWRSDRWLFHIKQRHDEYSNEQQIMKSFIRILAEVVGNETDAKNKIYIIWCKMPFGFGAEVDEETANKLKGLPDVLLVQPDYGFDVNKRNSGGLVISSKPEESWISVNNPWTLAKDREKGRTYSVVLKLCSYMIYI